MLYNRLHLGGESGPIINRVGFLLVLLAANPEGR